MLGQAGLAMAGHFFEHSIHLGLQVLIEIRGGASTLWPGVWEINAFRRVPAATSTRPRSSGTSSRSTRSPEKEKAPGGFPPGALLFCSLPAALT